MPISSTTKLLNVIKTIKGNVKITNNFIIQTKHVLISSALVDHVYEFGSVTMSNLDKKITQF